MPKCPAKFHWSIFHWCRFECTPLFIISLFRTGENTQEPGSRHVFNYVIMLIFLYTLNDQLYQFGLFLTVNPSTFLKQKPSRLGCHPPPMKNLLGLIDSYFLNRTGLRTPLIWYSALLKHYFPPVFKGQLTRAKEELEAEKRDLVRTSERRAQELEHLNGKGLRQEKPCWLMFTCVAVFQLFL